MKTLSALLFFSLILDVFSAVFLERLPFTKKHRNECYDKKTGMSYKVGETMEWDVCGRKLCFKDDKSLIIEYQTCGVMDFPKHCKKVVDLSLPYPECCGNVVCPDNISGKNKLQKTPSEAEKEKEPDFGSFENF